MEGFGSRTVATLTGLSLRQIDYWDHTHFIKPSLMGSSGKGTRRLYDFMDLVQFRVAASLRSQGISLQKIRKCTNYLRKQRVNLERPLVSLKFLTDGESIFVLTSDPKVVMDTLKEGQLVFSLGIGEILKDLKGKVSQIGKKQTVIVRVGKRRFTVVLHHDVEDGGYWVECPELPGCLSQGDTVEETLEMIRDAIRGHLAVMGKETLRRKTG
ncbi:MAG: MerR family transcriptional regulator [Deltaproteobacteria bacterium]|nr:MerR family transcriptional regulator [Deltaproteobacteria bacterium]